MDDNWNGLADLITNLISKYAGILDIENLPNPKPVKEQNSENNISTDMAYITVDKGLKSRYDNHNKTV